MQHDQHLCRPGWLIDSSCAARARAIFRSRPARASRSGAASSLPSAVFAGGLSPRRRHRPAIRKSPSHAAKDDQQQRQGGSSAGAASPARSGFFRRRLWTLQRSSQVCAAAQSSFFAAAVVVFRRRGVRFFAVAVVVSAATLGLCLGWRWLRSRFPAGAAGSGLGASFPPSARHALTLRRYRHRRQAIAPQQVDLGQASLSADVVQADRFFQGADRRDMRPTDQSAAVSRPGRDRQFGSA